MEGAATSFAYPADFVARVKAEFPYDDMLHKLLDKNQTFVGRILEDTCSIWLDSEKILSQIDRGEEGIAELRQQLEEHHRHKKLYQEWSKIYHDHYGR